jgi:hypothetical protein
LVVADICHEMTTIRTTCPRCGEVDMTPAAILLSVRDETGEGCYRFLCPTCLDPVEKPADRKIVALLISAGVDFADTVGTDLYDDEPTEAPAEQSGPRYSGPPFTMDDLLDFHMLLQDDKELTAALFAG